MGDFSWNKLKSFLRWVLRKACVKVVYLAVSAQEAEVRVREADTEGRKASSRMRHWVVQVVPFGGTLSGALWNHCQGCPPEGRWGKSISTSSSPPLVKGRPQALSPHTSGLGMSQWWLVPLQHLLPEGPHLGLRRVWSSPRPLPPALGKADRSLLRTN